MIRTHWLVLLRHIQSLHLRPSLMSLNCAVDWLAIVGAVGRDARNLALDLLEQDRHLTGVTGIIAGQHTPNKFARVSINGDVQFSPGPACPSGAFGIPTSLPKQLQAGAVDQQARGTVRDNMRPPIPKPRPLRLKVV
jgi:hypothetical protein